MLLEEFNFKLPPELIAEKPVEPRDASRLLKINSSTIFNDSLMVNFPEYINEGDILVFNDTKVIPSRLKGKIGDSKAEVTLHKKISGNKWLAFAKPAKKFIINKHFTIADDFYAKILSKNFGEVELEFNYSDNELFDYINNHGLMPLPPYIKREQDDTDKENYQTIYSKNIGAVAAPTAGLHFTDELFSKIKEKNIQTAFLTLHVGAGTFLPVKVDKVKDHKMHSEYGCVSQEVADKINTVKENGGKVISVGTTSLRLLESASDNNGKLQSFAGETDIFITPGYNFKIVDSLLTNFHLPKSTLFMLVSAFNGLETMQNAYQHAIEKNYRFFSYGDACFLSR